MTLNLYNTLTRTKEPFIPLDATNIRMYVCGPTVYDYAHIGNARPVIVFDLLFRLLRHIYGEQHVTYARNITDVDDKINKRAFERWTKQRPLVQEIRHLTDTTLAQFHTDIDALGILRPTHEPRATDYIARGDNTLDMVKVITRLIEKGHAYEAEGHVLFSVPSMPHYGALSRRPKDDIIAGARVEIAPCKRDVTDFVLWKPSTPDTEPGWDSPWGYGRPGWHIECSAMSGALLGEVFDIHGGGLDLIFPHHENEIAQSCCYSGQAKMANYWMHNGFLQVEGEKMSKSLGNFITINELLETRKFGGNKWHGYVLRFAMLMTHYRQPIDWTKDRLVEARKTLKDWIDIAQGYQYKHEQPPQELIDALSDDLNTHAALDIVRSLYKTAKTTLAYDDYCKLAASLIFMGLWKGEYSSIIYSYGYVVETIRGSDVVQTMVEARLAARATKNFAESDRIRDELVSMGVEIQDGKDDSGAPITSWKVK